MFYINLGGYCCLLKITNKLFRSIEINPTELCNFKCSFCPRAFDYPNQNLHMTKETIDVIVSQLDQLPNLETIYIAGRGEPTLHNEFEYLSNALADYCDKRGGLLLHLATNGNRMDRYKDVLQRYGVIKLSIYDETKPGEDKKYQNWKNVKIQYRQTDLIKSGAVKNSYHNRGGSVITEITHVQDIAHPKYGLMCEKPFDVVYIDWNGDYNLCCNDWEDIQVLGNIHSESLYEYTTNNKRLKEYQQQLLQGNRNINPCASCNKRLADEWVRYMEW